MASIDVISLEPGGSSDDYSFLTEVSGPCQTNGIVNSEFDLTNMQSALSTSTPDLSVEDVQMRLKELVDENESLKEALMKNNSLMKDKMSIISEWREQMIQSKSQQEQNLKLAKEKISLLEEENAKLRESLSKCETMKSQIPCKNCATLETVSHKLKDENMSMECTKKILVEQLGDMTQFQEEVHQGLLVIYNKLLNFLRPCSKLPEKDREELSSLIKCLGIKLNVLGENFGATVQSDEETGYVVVNKKTEQPISHFLKNSNEVENLKKDLEAKNKEISDYLLKSSSEVENLRKDLETKNKELDILRQNEKEMYEMIKILEKENEKQRKANFGLMCDKMSNESSPNEKYKERYENIFQEFERYKSEMAEVRVSDNHIMEQLIEESENMKKTLEFEQHEHQKKKEKLDEVLKQYEKLEVNYDRLDIQTKDEKKKNEEISIRRESEERSYMEQMDHLTAKVIHLEGELSDKVEEIDKLTKQLEEVREESETIPILKAQVEVYKNDLDHAVSTRDSAHAEIQNLERELKRLKKQEPKLHLTSKRKISKFSEPVTDDTRSYICPICGMGFDTVESVERHVERHDL